MEKITENLSVAKCGFLLKMSKRHFSCGANVKELQESKDLKRGYFFAVFHIDIIQRETEAEIKKLSRKQSEAVGRLMGLQAWD